MKEKFPACTARAISEVIRKPDMTKKMSTPKIAAGQQRQSGVINDHQQYRQATQRLDVSPLTHE
jgi:hypothetical protein